MDKSGRVAATGCDSLDSMEELPLTSSHSTERSAILKLATSSPQIDAAPAHTKHKQPRRHTVTEKPIQKAKSLAPVIRISAETVSHVYYI